MANPFAKSRTFHRIGHVTNTIPLKALTPGGIAVVTTIGRKSGKPRARAMRAVRDGDRVYAVSILGPNADWIANLKADSNLTVKVGGTTYRATGRVITDASELQKAEAVYRPVVGWYDYFDYANFVWSIPTKAKLLRAHDEWFEKGTPVVFELHDEAP